MAGVLSPRQGTCPANCHLESKSSLFFGPPKPGALAPGLAGRLIAHQVSQNPPSKLVWPDVARRFRLFPLGRGPRRWPSSAVPRKMRSWRTTRKKLAGANGRQHRSFRTVGCKCGSTRLHQYHEFEPSSATRRFKLSTLQCTLHAQLQAFFGVSVTEPVSRLRANADFSVRAARRSLRFFDRSAIQARGGGVKACSEARFIAWLAYPGQRLKHPLTTCSQRLVYCLVDGWSEYSRTVNRAPRGHVPSW